MRKRPGRDEGKRRVVYTMQEEKERATTPQAEGHKRRRRKKDSDPAAPARQGENGTEAAAGVEKPLAEEPPVPVQTADETQPPQVAEATEAAPQGDAAQPPQETSADGETAVSQPEEKETEAQQDAEPPQPDGKTVAEQPATVPEEPAEDPAPEPEELPQEESAPDPAPAPDEQEKAEQGQEVQHPAEDSTPEQSEEDREEKRLSDMTRTVQLSVAQILARVDQESGREDTEQETSPEEPQEEPQPTLQEHLRYGLSGIAKWLLLVVFFVLVIAGFGVAWLYRSATPDMLPRITVTFAGQTVEPAAYKWKVPVVGNIFKRTFAETFDSAPAELAETVTQTSPDFTVSPAGYRTEVTITDSAEEVIFEGDVDSFSEFQFSANGSYTAKLVVYSDASAVPGDAAVTGSETWQFSFSIGVQPSIRLSSATVDQGSVAALRVGETLDGQPPKIDTQLENTGFVAASSGWVCYLPIPWNQPADTCEIQVTVGDYTQTLELKIREVDWEYKDYYSESQRAAPYIGQQDLPAELSKLLRQSESTIAWTDGNFVQPFLNTLDVKIPFGTTEYVGRSYSERGTNTGAGGRTFTNMILNTSKGELLIAPASGTVVLAKDLGGDWGYTLVIDHGAGVKSLFYNLQSCDVKAGAAVKQGQVLAACGRITVAEMRIGTVPIDPLPVWRGQCDAVKYY